MRIRNMGVDLDLPRRFAGPDHSDEAVLAANPGVVITRHRVGSRMRRTIVLPSFLPTSLFTASEQGLWLDPSDLDTVFQDAAGTTPGAVDQPVGLILDKSGNDNHASQSNATQRPMLRQDANGCYYLEFDGADDSLKTGAVDFSGSDQMTVITGVRKLNEASASPIVALTDATNGSFELLAPSGANGRNYNWRSRGTANSFANSAANYPSPISNVVSCLSDISGTRAVLRVDGEVEQDNTVTSQGTGNFANTPIYIGRRGTSGALKLTGRIYGLIIRDVMVSDAELAQAEAFMNTKMTGAAAFPVRSDRWRLLLPDGRYTAPQDAQVGLSEVEFYAPNDGTANLAVGGAATASGWESSNTPAEAFDGNKDLDGWFTRDAPILGAWLEYAFSGPVAIGDFRVWFMFDFNSPGSITLQAFVGDEWVDVRAYTGFTPASSETILFKEDGTMAA